MLSAVLSLFAIQFTQPNRLRVSFIWCEINSIFLEIMHKGIDSS